VGKRDAAAYLAYISRAFNGMGRQYQHAAALPEHHHEVPEHFHEVTGSVDPQPVHAWANKHASESENSLCR